MCGFPARDALNSGYIKKGMRADGHRVAHPPMSLRLFRMCKVCGKKLGYFLSALTQLQIPVLALSGAADTFIAPEEGCRRLGIRFQGTRYHISSMRGGDRIFRKLHPRTPDFVKACQSRDLADTCPMDGQENPAGANYLRENFILEAAHFLFLKR